ncbi:acyltransferase family protein [Shewanella algicola]|uniref:Acyltransferase family protein n=1 Tax=Shewanella algicola TaxID=640633 RepID=A0A9X1Z5W8_9GAMM|nr:acyltransferase family protein [Shewanella algicola]MCL1104354.1 acyltransferase family protein [Shewanella algicola]
MDKVLPQIRRYSELDWLRVILIFAVFLHHVFMPFNGDGWHVMNNESSTVLDDIMVYFEQLRLQALFFIAGAGSLLLLQKMSAKSFMISKFHRLFIPLLVGMILIVPPQNYFENIADYESLLSAYSQLMWSFDNNHLWFIEFLLIFMLLAIPFKCFLDGATGTVWLKWLERLSQSPYGLLSLGLVLVIVRGLAKYLMPDDSHHIENLSLSLFYLFFFLAGMSFIYSGQVWQTLALHRRTYLISLLISTLLFYAYYYSPDLSPYLSLTARWQIWWWVCTMVSWSGLLTMVGFASAYINRTPTWLQQTNELIYPFYILHQTVIVMLAFYIVQWQAGIMIKSLSLLVSAFIICVALCYWVIKPFNLMRYLFGLKKLNPRGPETQ